MAGAFSDQIIMGANCKKIFATNLLLFLTTAASSFPQIAAEEHPKPADFSVLQSVVFYLHNDQSKRGRKPAGSAFLTLRNDDFAIVKHLWTQHHRAVFSKVL